MNKKVLATIGVITALIAASTLYLLLTPREAATPIDNTATSTGSIASSEVTPNNQITPTQPATYINYTAEAFESEQGTKLLFFYADWCPKCRALDADIQANVASLSDLTIYKVNYDTELELRKQYGVTQQTTVVKTDKGGAKLDSFIAYDSPSLASVRENLEL